MSTSSFRLDLAREDDLSALLQLVRAFHDFEQVEMTDGERRAVLEPLLRPGNPDGRIWMVRAGPTASGYLALTFGYSIEFRGRDAFVDEFFLDESLRGRGIGSEVLDRVKAEAAVLGVHALHLEVARDNESARRLYERWGFRARERFHLMSCHLVPAAVDR